MQHLPLPLNTDIVQPRAICIGIGETININRTEDRLFMNVYTPNDATRSSKLPVWVYILGGGYARETNGNYNGIDVVRTSGGNIVFVNFNYRVSAYGFLASEKVREDGDLNVGLLDQRKAFYWVQKYITEVSQRRDLTYHKSSTIDLVSVWRRPGPRRDSWRF